MKRYTSFWLVLWIGVSFFLAASLLGGEDSAVPECSVAIDIGHSRKYPGATSARGVGEYYFNERIGRLLLGALHARGMRKSFLIEDLGRNVHATTRAQRAAQRKADLLISLHHDSVQPHYLSFWRFNGRKNHYCDKFEGYSIFVSQKNCKFEKSLAWATILGEELYKGGFRPSLHHAEKIKGENRELLNTRLGIYRFDDLIILKHASMPTLLLECGIIVNREEEKRLGEPDTMKGLVSAICDSVEKHLLTRHGSRNKCFLKERTLSEPHIPVERKQ